MFVPHLLRAQQKPFSLAARLPGRGMLALLLALERLLGRRGFIPRSRLLSQPRGGGTGRRLRMHKPTALKKSRLRKEESPSEKLIAGLNSSFDKFGIFNPPKSYTPSHFPWFFYPSDFQNTGTQP